MRLVVMVEEQSMKIVLEEILPQILPQQVSFVVIPFQGKGDLMNGIPIKLRGWNEPDARFVIVRDQDRADCHAVKDEVLEAVGEARRPVIVRIVCRELESWYFGDLKAVSRAYGKDYTGYENKRGYRDPDAIHDVKMRFIRMVPEHQQISGARRIAPYLDIEHNKSRSFNVFVAGVRKLIAAPM